MPGTGPLNLFDVFLYSCFFYSRQVLKDLKRGDPIAFTIVIPYFAVTGWCLPRKVTDQGRFRRHHAAAYTGKD